MLLKQFLNQKPVTAPVVEKPISNVLEVSMESFGDIMAFDVTPGLDINKDVAALNSLLEIKGTMKSLSGIATTETVLASVESANLILDTVGLDAIQTLSMESFEDSPEFTLSVSMEGVGDSIEKLKEKIKVKIKNFNIGFKLFTNSLSTNTKGILKSVKVLEENMKGLEGDYVKSTDKVSAKNLRGLLVDNKMYDKDFSEFKSIAEEIQKDWSVTSKKIETMTPNETEDWRNALTRHSVDLPGNIKLSLDGVKSSANVEVVKMTTTEVDALDEKEILKSITLIKKILSDTEEINKGPLHAIIGESILLYETETDKISQEKFTRLINGFSSFYDAIEIIAKSGNKYANSLLGLSQASYKSLIKK